MTLSVAIAGEAVTVDSVPGKSSVVSMAQVGRPNALHATAIGKTMLAFGPQARCPAAAELTRVQDRSIGKVAELERVVEQVRKAGWAKRWPSARTTSPPSRRPSSAPTAGSPPWSACRGRWRG